MQPNITNERSTVLVAVCLLRNYPWSRENTTASNALFAMKEAIINNSCSWVNIFYVSCWIGLIKSRTQQLSSRDQPISCDDLSAFCTTVEVMSEIQRLLFAILKECHPNESLDCNTWITNNLSGYNNDIITNSCKDF